MRLDPVRFRYRLQRNRPREVSLRGSVSCKSSSGWDPLGSSSFRIRYPVFKVPRLPSEGVPRQAARMYITRPARAAQAPFRSSTFPPQAGPEGGGPGGASPAAPPREGAAGAPCRGAGQLGPLLSLYAPPFRMHRTSIRDGRRAMEKRGGRRAMAGRVIGIREDEGVRERKTPPLETRDGA